MESPEGPIVSATPLSEVKKEPGKLNEKYEWTTCDMQSDDMCSEVCRLLNDHYSEAAGAFRFHYSREFLMWALCPPGYHQSWHLGVRATTSKRLVAFIGAVPARIRVRDKVVNMATINFFCVLAKLRSKKVGKAMIKELGRRVHLENIWQAAYRENFVESMTQTLTNLLLPDNATPPITMCTYWIRTLNPQKLMDVGFTQIGQRMTIPRFLRLYKLPDATVTPGFRAMGLGDVSAVQELLRNYLGKFLVAQDFDFNDVTHWFFPKDKVVYSYVVVSQETYEITDFVSFYSLPSTIFGNPRYDTLQGSYSYYNVATKTPFHQLMNDALIASKQNGFDLFYALDVMDNDRTFFTELKFKEGDNKLHNHLYNYRLNSALKPSELGLLLV